MADSKTLLQKYVSDMLALESHIHQAIDKQVKENKYEPEVKTKFEAFSQTVKLHRDQLETRLEQLGGSANSGIKEGVAAVMGVAAGIIDKFRSEEVSKDFRDDFTALNLSLISYVMLHTTALSVGDRETAELAARNVRDNAQFVMYIQKIMPTVVVQELQKNHEASINESVAEETRQLVSEIWK
jgi:ferritin-like metal-binding protein YciE